VDTSTLLVFTRRTNDAHSAGAWLGFVHSLTGNVRCQFAKKAAIGEQVNQRQPREAASDLPEKFAALAGRRSAIRNETRGSHGLFLSQYKPDVDTTSPADIGLGLVFALRNLVSRKV